jgi:hypothetical protein
VLAVDGTIDFYWRVFVDSESSGALGSFRFGEFFAPEYDRRLSDRRARYRRPQQRHPLLRVFDSYVNFNFAGGLQPGDSSYFLLMDTTATAYAKTASST